MKVCGGDAAAGSGITQVGTLRSWKYLSPAKDGENGAERGVSDGNC